MIKVLFKNKKKNTVPWVFAINQKLFKLKYQN